MWYCLAVGCQLFYDVCLGNSSVGLRKCWGGEKVAVGDYHYSVYKLSDCCTHSPQFKWITFLSASWVPACSSLPDVLLPVSDSTHAHFIQGHRLTKDGFHRLFIFNLFNHDELFPLSSAVTFLPLALSYVNFSYLSLSTSEFNSFQNFHLNIMKRFASTQTPTWESKG